MPRTTNAPPRKVRPGTTADRLTQRYASTAEIVRARAEHGSDDLQVDDGAHVSPAERGVWVAAWVWLPHAEG